MSKVTLPDPSLKDISLKLYPELERLKDAYFKSAPEMCVERSDRMSSFFSQPKQYAFPTAYPISQESLILECGACLLACPRKAIDLKYYDRIHRDKCNA